MQTTKPNNQALDLKVLSCQLKPQFKEITNNIKHVDSSLTRYSTKDELDVVIFPEMAFTGYCFKDKEDIKPVLEESTKGETFAYCSSLAKRLNCYVMAGYPELYINPETKKEHLYNSAYVVDREGKLALNYRKHFLYETDHNWAEEGPSFQTVILKNTKGIEYKAAVAICMDINPYEFKDSNEFKLAEFCRKEEIDALFFLANWLDPEATEESKIASEAINYWIYRLYLLVQNDEFKDRYTRKWAFFCANRVGQEDKYPFLGCSCTIKFNPVQLVGCLGPKNEGFLLSEVSL